VLGKRKGQVEKFEEGDILIDDGKPTQKVVNGKRNKKQYGDGVWEGRRKLSDPKLFVKIKRGKRLAVLTNFRRKLTVPKMTEGELRARKESASDRNKRKRAGVSHAPE
jgi:hypothetical protein